MAQSNLAAPVGLPLDRVDGRLKVTGKAPYAYEYASLGDALYGVIVPASIAKGRRQLLWFEVTRHPTTVAGSANHRGVSLELGASLPGARQRPRLRPRLHVSGEGNGYPRPPGLSCVTVAERLC